MSRIVLTAQEDLRREIARAMHDGPAQSLTNIVLQAQIVERLLATDPDAARGRGPPARLDGPADPGRDEDVHLRRPARWSSTTSASCPTLRRAARERGRRAGVAVEFESVGADRRLPVELESGLFRILDEALAAYSAPAPDRVALRLDWAEEPSRRARRTRDRTSAAAAAEREAAARRRPTGRQGLPPALAAMIEDRRRTGEAAAETARSEAIVALPAKAWREIEQRAATVGIERRDARRRRRAARSVVDIRAGEPP